MFPEEVLGVGKVVAGQVVDGRAAAAGPVVVVARNSGRILVAEVGRGVVFTLNRTLGIPTVVPSWWTSQLPVTKSMSSSTLANSAGSRSA